jgi:hypothetical protein
MKSITPRVTGRKRAMALVPLVLAGAWIGILAPAAQAHAWPPGTIFAATSGGQYVQFNSAGVLEDTLNTFVPGPDGGFTVGCALSPGGAQNLYTTDFPNKRVVVMSSGATHTVAASIDLTAGTGTTGRPESIVFASNGDFYVGLVDAAAGEPNLLKYDKNNNFLAGYTLITTDERRGVTWFDLAADQHTIYYTSTGPNVWKYDLNSPPATPSTLFAGGLERAYGLRLLRGGNSFGGAGGPGFLAVADTSVIRVYDAAGTQTNSFDIPGHDGWFAISIVPGGTQLAATDFYTGDLVKFNGDGTVASSFNINPDPFRVNGLCVKGEVTTGIVPFPSDGFFVVGDVSAANAGSSGVNFWGSQWEKRNTLSLGDAGNNAFKGFAERTSQPTPTCGDTFISKGGNSKPPAVVPDQVAVLVTKQLTKAGGGDTAGVISAIVIVQVDPGYGPVPGKPGTGTVVSVVCSMP